MKKRALLIGMCLALVATASVLGTLAYLTDTDGAVNTFTIGQVDIALDEADVDEDGRLIVDEKGQPVDRVQGTEYHLIPGLTYIKDPTITVKSGSEEAYVRMMVTVTRAKELNAIFAPEGADLAAIFDGYDPERWACIGSVTNETDNTITYEFRWHEPVAGGDEDAMLDALFKTFTVPGEITGEELKTIQGMQITVTGHAIQAAGFDDADAAWEAFASQMADDGQ